jgi:carboxylesterase type B
MGMSHKKGLTITPVLFSIYNLQEVARLTADLVFFIPMVKLADVISQWMEQVYLFSFQYASQDPTGPSWQGKYILTD